MQGIYLDGRNLSLFHCKLMASLNVVLNAKLTKDSIQSSKARENLPRYCVSEESLILLFTEWSNERNMY